VFSSTDFIAINILAECQKDLSGRFASKCEDRFSGVNWCAGFGGSPLLDGCAAWFSCQVYERITAGDHLIIIARVIEFHTGAVGVLGYWRGTYFAPELAENALTASGYGVSIGAILELNESVILIKRREDRFDVPTGTCLEPVNYPDSLPSILRELGVTATFDYLFSMIRENDRGKERVYIYYRGTLTSGPERRAAVELIPLSEVPNLTFVNESVESMLRRYVKERQETTFGIYFGDTRRGIIASIAETNLVEI
jgi:hypothetical protein